MAKNDPTPAEASQDGTEDHDNFAPDYSLPASTEYPVGIFVGEGATSTFVGDLGEFAVDPETGRITGPVA